MADPRIVPTDGVAAGGPAGASDRGTEAFDPLRLCVFATVALLGWLLGPVALAVFAGIGVLGYARARRAGLLRSKCLLGDTRIVLAYLGLLAVVAVAALVVGFGPWQPWERT